MPRSDLALESAQDIEPQQLPPEEFSKQTVCRGRVTITYIHIKGEKAADAVGKPCGRYITVQLPPLSEATADLARMAQSIALPLRQLLPCQGTVLVVGLGNEAITPDALGPQSVRRVLATRHIRGEYARAAGLADLRPVVTVESGVLGKTGMESGEMVRAVVGAIKPCAVIAVDALAARSIERLGSTVQIGDSGIVPGSGIGNSRKALDRQTLGVPVIAVGVPTVVDAATLVEDLTGQPSVADRQMMVTPREVDLMVHQASLLVAMSINAALQPHYAAAELTDMAL